MILNGYYLFVYSEIDPVLNVLGKSRRHDHCLSVFYKNDMDITLICHHEFERYSGFKHHNIAFYSKEDAEIFINTLLEPYSLSINDFVGIYGLPGLTADTDISYTSINDIKDISYHSICHLFSSLCMDTEKFYNNIILSLSFDGGPDALIDKKIDGKYYFCGALSYKGEIKYFPISSPGGYWLYLSDYFDMPEGTLMALAYATKAKSLETFKPLSNYYKASDRTIFIDEINKIIDRIMGYSDSDEGVLFVKENDTRFSEVETKISMIVKVIQELSIKNVFTQIDKILLDYSLISSDIMVALSGGYALNCPTNSKIMEKYHFKGQLCVPCINDSGLSLGMGLYYFFKNCKQFNFKLSSAYYGYNDKENLFGTIDDFRYFIADVTRGISQASNDIQKSPVVWIDGNAEIGPRALGHRSILANPMDMEHKNLLNLYKQREWWRPVAPIILEKYVKEWFENGFSSPYMLNNFCVDSTLSDHVLGILHLDGTARVQTIDYNLDNKLWKVVSDFYELTGIPIISNTSLNDKGEPIVNTIAQALNFALRKKIKIVYAYGYRIELCNHKDYGEKSPLIRFNNLFISHVKEYKKIIKQINPHGLSKTELLIYMYSPSLSVYDIKNYTEAMTVRNIVRKLKRVSGDLKFFEV